LKNKEILIGFIIGLIANIIGVFISVMILFKELNFSKTFNIINNSIENGFLTKLISLGAVINLISFFLLLKYDYVEKARGVLIATFFMAILTIYLNNF
tara:strand:+ start:611 stop:904 length:294 start_codon:yes stop_codon:yes gene_type:complete